MAIKRKNRARTMKLTLIIFFAFFVPIAFPQQADSKPEPRVSPPAKVTRVVRVRYGIPQKIADLLFPGTPVTITADNFSKVIVLKGDPNLVASLEQTIREIDVPGAAPASYQSKDIELVVSVIGGSDKTELLSEGQVPEAMAPVIKQLRAVFPYKSYQLLSSMLLRSREGGKSGSEGAMKTLVNIGNYSYPSRYTVGYDEASVSTEDSKPIVYLRNFSFKMHYPVVTGILGKDNMNYATTQFQQSDLAIVTDVHLREAQKIVVGKANIDSNDLALFVVLTARLVE
jgi:hypothetical protein